ncbi:hypothetical protein M501DRAFT_1003387 [Patellaria atrata CBS 101060]|uniref:Uncharacterized protein n=1 Tax=Patellaria atrata CBS 101060 TaxID=1346257 RepID=A0A9P4SDR5_9PEZI|nr:hypothetical protein M501DRAFT_1003387 [Patellaria atrata CBS 101060]
MPLKLKKRNKHDLEKPIVKEPKEKWEKKRRGFRSIFGFSKNKRKGNDTYDTGKNGITPYKEKEAMGNDSSATRPSEHSRDPTAPTQSRRRDPIDPSDTSPPNDDVPTGLPSSHDGLACHTIEGGKDIQSQQNISRTLSEDGIRKIFSGASQFIVKDMAGDRRQPQAGFPFDFGLVKKDLSDSVSISHPSFSAVTCRPHLCAPGNKDGRSQGSVGYAIPALEVPNTLSAQGEEPGTVGFEYFLQLPISDNLRVEDEDPPLKDDVFDPARNYELLHTYPEKLGIRRINITFMAERLQELGTWYQEFRASGMKTTLLDKQNIGEMYTQLFCQLLTPPKFDNQAGDPVGLKVQIEDIVKSLRLKGIWKDFSLVEWRIRLGQLLWSSDTAEDGHSGTSDGPDEVNDRNILLLQISLACELLVRLDVVSTLSAEEVKNDINLTTEEVVSFESLKTRKIDWDLILARRFLENVKAIEYTPPRPEPQPKKWGFLTINPTQDQQPAETKPEVILLPRNQSRQLDGLLHFATNISWPHLDLLSSHLVSKLQGDSNAENMPSPSIYATPISTPRSITSNRSSYFGGSLSRTQPNRTATSRSLKLQPSLRTINPPPSSDIKAKDEATAPLDIGGWLSRSYFTGLIMPGEPLSHLLISTLLENDSAAIEALGDDANLYGGFSYGHRSWWSKACVAGRVLAALDGTAECMGWISVPVVPEGWQDGWIDVSSEAISTAMDDNDTKRIDTEKVQKESDFLSNFEPGQLEEMDLTMPRDGSPVEGAEDVQFVGLKLDPTINCPSVDGSGGSRFVEELADREQEEVETRLQSHTAHLTFSFPSALSDNDEETRTLTLKYDVHFISAFPCTPPNEDVRTVVEIPTSPSKTKRAKPVSAHPLHKDFEYRTVPATDLLFPDFTTSVPPSPALSRAGSSPKRKRRHATESKEKDEESPSTPALILDARDSPVLSALARAWCAETGRHAVVARVGRTCLACAVREAKGLGVGVVVRV